MEPKSFGKKLGIGVRVAGNIARDRAQEAAKRREHEVSASARPVGPTLRVQDVGRQAQKVAERGRNLGQGIERGSRNFKHSFLHPFANASGVLWLEITGCFFALFALFFAQNIYRVRTQYAAGPEHRTFLLYCFLTLIFTYFSASSFIKARRRSRQGSSR